MRRSQTATRLLAIAFLTLAGLTATACSRPTPANPPADGTGSEGGESIPPGPYYDDEAAGEPLQEGDEGYPGPGSRPAEYFPEPYPEPEDVDTDADEASSDEAEGSDEDAGDATDETSEESTDESSDG